MKTDLYAPSRCTAKLPDDFNKSYYVAEEKIDGSRYVLYFACDPYDRRPDQNTLLSRRPSSVDGKLVDKSLNVPHITDRDYGLDGTVIDGEIQADDFTMTNAIMNSSPFVAAKKQKESGLVKFRAFDIMAFRGKDIRHLSLAERRKILKNVVDRMDNPHVVMVEQITEGIEEFFTHIVSKGGEGIVLKDLRQAYGVGWAKMKKSYDVTCFISGFKDGNGKYEGGVGSIAISVFKHKYDVIVGDEESIEVGFASGFDDAIRADMAKNPKKYIGRAVDVFAQEISKDNRLRHPTFHRFRDDVNQIECTMDKLKKDIASFAKSRRRKEE